MDEQPTIDPQKLAEALKHLENALKSLSQTIKDLGARIAKLEMDVWKENEEPF